MIDIFLVSNIDTKAIIFNNFLRHKLVCTIRCHFQNYPIEDEVRSCIPCLCNEILNIDFYSLEH